MIVGDVALVIVEDVDAEGRCFGDVLDLPDLVPYGGECVGLDGRAVAMVRCNAGAADASSSGKRGGSPGAYTAPQTSQARPKPLRRPSERAWI